MNINKTQIAKAPARFFVLFVASLCVATAVSFIAVAVPAPGFHARIGENIKTLSWHSDFYPSVISGRNFSRLDNHTDALMTQLSMDNPSASLTQQAFDPLVIRTFVDGVRKIPNMVKSLEARYYGGAKPDFGYGRYWHGYRAPLRLLGSVMNYQQLRMLNYVCMSLLLLLSCYQVLKTFNRIFMWLYTGCLFAVSIYLVPLSLQYISVFYVLLISVSMLCYFLRKKGAEAPLIEIFALSAFAVAFFDFLTSPLIVGGMLTVLYAVWVYRGKVITGKKAALQIGGLYALWFVSYIAFWASKAVVAWLFNVQGVFSSFTGQVHDHIVYATSADWINAIPFNLATFMGASSLDANMKDIYYWLYVIGFFVLLLVSVIVWLFILRRQRNKLSLGITRRYLPLLAVAVTPFMWWQAKAWQSANHLFVYREIAIFLFALGTFYILTIYKARYVAKQVTPITAIEGGQNE